MKKKPKYSDTLFAPGKKSMWAGLTSCMNLVGIIERQVRSGHLDLKLVDTNRNVVMTPKEYVTFAKRTLRQAYVSMNDAQRKAEVYQVLSPR